jgi:hypothetical protein
MVYHATASKIGEQMRRYDEYGELLQRFSENMTSL